MVSWVTLPIWRAQGGEAGLADVDAVDEDAAAGDVEEAGNEIDQGRLPCSAGSDERDDFAAVDGEVDVVEDDGRALALAFAIAEAHVIELNAVLESFEDARMFGFADFVLIVHEVEDGGGGSGGLLEIVVVDAEAADGVVHLEQRDDEGEEDALRHGAVADLVAADPQQRGNCDGSDEIHERRGNRLGADRAEIGAEEPLGGLAEAEEFPELHVEGFHDAIAGDGLVQDVLDIGELVLAAAGGAANIAADAENGPGGDHGQKDRQNPGQACPPARSR